MQCLLNKKVILMDNKEFLIQSVKHYNVTQDKINILYDYCVFLMTENEKYDLTAIKTFQEIVQFHIIDSLHVLTVKDFVDATIITDIGTGAGAPGLILALVCDDKQFNLVEILQKRIVFLQTMINHFELKNCTIIPFDFKTVIRKKLADQKTIFISRATLSFDKLLYIFNGASIYNQSLLLYWAARNWKNGLGEEYSDVLASFCINEFPYTIGERERIYVVAKKNYNE